MTDEEADKIHDATDDVVTDAPQASPEGQADAPAADEQKLTELMAEPAADAEKQSDAPAADLEQQALAAAEQALAQGEQALAEAEGELAKQQPQARPQAQPKRAPVQGSRRELVLRALLAVNVVAMIVVALMPGPTEQAAPTPAPETPTATTEPVTPEPATPTPTPAMNEPWNQALRASERHDWATAVQLLEGYLEDGGETMPSSERLSVLSALSFYASRAKDFDRSRRYTQMAQALEQSHSLPDDLVKEAAAALQAGDRETLRRVWARFLLQQRQVPSYLYHHVAQAYLELGDSYRQDADAGARAARDKELKEAAAQLKREAMSQEGGK